ncbi:MAG: biotin-dependent carboxyltransferase family protein [Pseudomonadota bacterium]
MSGFRVLAPGMLSLIQDGGRFGRHDIGLTTGGPLDRLAMSWANRLLGNRAETSAIEASFGGLKLEVDIHTQICVTGGDQPLSINGEERAGWRSHCVNPGDQIEMGFARQFCRSYLAVSGGFDIEPSFGSTATVVREGVGGLRGEKLARDDYLPAVENTDKLCLALPAAARPRYSRDVMLRVIPGYQHLHFPKLELQRLFSSEYRVTDRADRMGYRLEGPAIHCELDRLLSEGICMGAIQVPADGQPIVLLKDRQTIGGYPKVGSALSMDTAQLAQQMPGASARFRRISAHEADNVFHLVRSQYHRQEPEPVRD